MNLDEDLLAKINELSDLLKKAKTLCMTVVINLEGNLSIYGNMGAENRKETAREMFLAALHSLDQEKDNIIDPFRLN